MFFFATLELRKSGARQLSNKVIVATSATLPGSPSTQHHGKESDEGSLKEEVAKKQTQRAGKRSKHNRKKGSSCSPQGGEVEKAKKAWMDHLYWMTQQGII